MESVIKRANPICTWVGGLGGCVRGDYEGSCVR